MSGARTDDELVAAHLYLVWDCVARHFANVPVARDDLIGAGTLGLVKATASRNPSSRTFASYAYARIRGEILDELRRDDHLTRPLRARAKDPADAFVDPGPPAALPLEMPGHADDAQEAAAISRVAAAQATTVALSALGSRPRLVVFLRFWADASLAEIADTLGLSESMISRELSAALGRLNGHVALEAWSA